MILPLVVLLHASSTAVAGAAQETAADVSPAPAPEPVPAAEGAPLESSFRYDFVEAGVALGDLDGLRVGASYGLEGPWIAQGRLEYLGEDEGRTDVDLLLLSAGAGYVHTIREDLDFVGSAELQYGRADVDTPSGSFDDDELGIHLRAGVRFQADTKLELAGGLSVRTIFDEDLGLDALGIYSFDENAAAFVGFELRDDAFATFGVRFYL